MNAAYIKLLNRLRSRYADRQAAQEMFGVSYDDAQFSHQEASDKIKEKLLGPSPAMICRFGQVELGCVANYHFITDKKSLPAKSYDYIKGRAKPFWWEEQTLDEMCNNAGFFPRDPTLMERFCELMLADMKEVDILGSWLREEKLFATNLQKAVKVRLPDLEPYYHQRPWSEALRDKTVLVVHPYEDSIRKQYRNRRLLFGNEAVLPEFELVTIKAVQSIANTDTGFGTWFDAYRHMCDRISAAHFDIAIIGCGAYGFPLAAHVKRTGRKAVHLGGATQVLFGIKGKRWDNHEVISKLMNEHWIRPGQSEVPANFTKVEDGCYW